MGELTRDNAEKIEINKNKIEDFVLELIQCRENGMSVCADFAGKTFFSCDVSLDSAFLEITGYTYQQYKDYENENMKEFEKNLQDHNIVGKHEEQDIQEVCEEEKEELKGIIVDNKEEIIENEEIEQLEEDCQEVVTSEELFEDEANEEDAEIGIENNDKVVEENQVLEFGEESQQNKKKKECEDINFLIQKWIKEGQRYTYPQRAEEWENCVKQRARDIYAGADIKCALSLMEMIEQGKSLEFVRLKLAEQNYSPYVHSMIEIMILRFSKNGPEYVEYIETKNGKISGENKQAIQKVKKENEVFAQELQKNYAKRAEDIDNILKKQNEKITLLELISRIEGTLAKLHQQEADKIKKVNENN